MADEVKVEPKKKRSMQDWMALGFIVLGGVLETLNHVFALMPDARGIGAAISFLTMVYQFGLKMGFKRSASEVKTADMTTEQVAARLGEKH